MNKQFLFSTKHKDSFSKSENLSIFSSEKLWYLIMIIQANHQAVTVWSESLLFCYNHLFELYFKSFGSPANQSILYTDLLHTKSFLQGLIIIKLLI